MQQVVLAQWHVYDRYYQFMLHVDCSWKLMLYSKVIFNNCPIFPFPIIKKTTTHTVIETDWSWKII